MNSILIFCHRACIYLLFTAVGFASSAQGDNTRVAGWEPGVTRPQLTPLPSRMKPGRLQTAVGLDAKRSHQRRSAAQERIASSGIRFTENLGQVADTEGRPRPEVLYTADAGMARLYFTSRSISYVFTKIDAPRPRISEATGMEMPDEAAMEERARESKLYRMDLEFEGANPSARLKTEEMLPGCFNYYLPSCPDGITQVKSYGRLVCENIYENIDLVYRSSGPDMKYEFIVHPGGEVSDIRIRYRGAARMACDALGNLHVDTPLGSVEEEAPITYQTGRWNATREQIASTYVIDGHTLSFDVGVYDASQDLVIDPWARLYGGSGPEFAYGIALVDSGSVVITGSTTSDNLPVTHSSVFAGLLDAFIAKFDSSGTLVWATYYGGGHQDYAREVAVDGSGNLLLAGLTRSSDFPVTKGPAHAGEDDAFILKLGSDGTVIWATMLGGSANDDAWSVSVDARGDLVFGGSTRSTDFPVTNGSSSGTWKDVFLVKFSVDGDLIWSTYLSGDSDDQLAGIATDGSGNISIAGTTRSTNFPVTDSSRHMGNDDAFIGKLQGDGTVLWMKYFGGSSQDIVAGLGLDEEDNIVITGHTWSRDMPVTNTSANAGGYDVFITKFSSAGIVLWSMFYGGSSADGPECVAVDRDGSVIIGGSTHSTDFPVTSSRTFGGGVHDAFIVKFNSSGAVLWSTYYGSMGNEEAFCIATDKYGNVVVAGYTTSQDFPVTMAPPFAGNCDAFIIHFTPDGIVPVEATAPSFESAQLHAPYPHPAQHEFSVPVTLPAEHAVHVTVYDVLGRAVERVPQSALSTPGYRLLRFEADTWEAGLYTIEMVAGTRSFTRTVLIER